MGRAFKDMRAIEAADQVLECVLPAVTGAGDAQSVASFGETSPL